MPADEKKFFSKKKYILFRSLFLTRILVLQLIRITQRQYLQKKPRLDYFADREGREVIVHCVGKAVNTSLITS